MKYYAVAEVNVTNPHWVPEYMAKVNQIVESYGGKYLARTSNHELVEGNTPRQEAMIDFAMKVTNDSRSISQGDFETLRPNGFSDEDIWDIAGITAFFNLSNRMMNFAAIRPDDEFYMMGRH